jgi:putative hydrolase
MRQMQGTMSLVEGYSNLVMNELGAKLLPGFERLEEAYRARSKSKSILELLIWKLSGLDLKLQQYSRGEAFAKAVYDSHGMKGLNLAWQGPQTMPRVDELANPEGWYRRVTTAPRSRR